MHAKKCSVTNESAEGVGPGALAHTFLQKFKRCNFMHSGVIFVRYASGINMLFFLTLLVAKAEKNSFVSPVLL